MALPCHIDRQRFFVSGFFVLFHQRNPLVLVAVLYRGDALYLFKHLTEIVLVSISYFLRHFIDSAILTP